MEAVSGSAALELVYWSEDGFMLAKIKSQHTLELSLCEFLLLVVGFDML